MPERPIIFTGAMVRAILNNTKTQTRRIVKPQPPGPLIPTPHPGEWQTHFTHGGEWMCPHGTEGDLLWVRETWAPCDCQQDFCNGFVYKADWIDPTMKTDRMRQAGNRWRSPIHMPKRAARLWLRVKSVRVERLQAITESDAIEEGCSGQPAVGVSAGHDFTDTWCLIHGEDSWEADPWVWVIEFKREEPDRVE